MTLEAFIGTIHVREVPELPEPSLLALWHERGGDWEMAHQIVQELETASASLVHAYLHRREGDESNARYWYSRAGRRFPAGLTLDDEWVSLVSELLERV